GIAFEKSSISNERRNNEQDEIRNDPHPEEISVFFSQRELHTSIVYDFYVSSTRKGRSALVLAGGGTRGAYEVGVVHYLRTMLPPDLAKRFQFQIHCGSSVGAINTAFMAATAHDATFQGNELVRLWRNIRAENIYRRGPFSFGKFLFRSGLGIAMHII